MDDQRTPGTLSPEERRARRIERRKRELRIARIKFGAICLAIILALILIIVGCTKGCKRDAAPETSESTVSTTEDTTPTEPPKPTFSYKASDWKLILVDADHPLPENYDVELTTLRSGAKVSSQLMDNLQDMVDACREAGLKPLVISGYQSSTDQQKQFETRVSELMSMGYTQELAEKEAQKTISMPGTSEFETGLALIIASENNKDTNDTKIGEIDELVWMRDNAWKYGFVERYTEAQATRNGVTYQPCWYRYVGKNAAQDMHDNDYCLEELVALLEP